MRSVLLAVLVALFLVGPVGAQDVPPEQVAATAPTASAEVAFTWIDPDGELFRFASYIRHPHEYTVEGITTRWEAYDASGAIVGSRVTKHPPILAGMALPYVGGAGSVFLSGTPARVGLFVVDPGRRTDALPRIFAVDSVELAQEGTARRTRAHQYRVAATVTTDGAPVARGDIFAEIIVKDAGGTIVGAGFETPDTVPDVLAPGTRFRVEDRFINTTGPAATAEVVVYARPD